jgi:hypothetical protein
MSRIHDIRLEGPAIRAERISGPLLHDLLHLIVEGSQRALRFRLEGRSTARGTPPAWLKNASIFDVLPEKDGKAIHLDAPPLLETMPERFKQRDLFADLDPTKSALDLFEDGLEDALNGEAESDRYDEGLVDTFSAFSALLEEGVERLEIVNGRTLPVALDGLDRIAQLRRQTPLPQAVRVVGKVDAIRHSDRMFTLVLEGGLTLRGLAEAVDAKKLASMWGKVALVTGRAVFRPSGTVLRVEAEMMSEANERDAAIWSTLPKPAMAPLDLRKLHVPQGPRSGINAIWGQWPGDESYEEFLAALEELS